jgi:hypothetical protein
VVVSERGAAAVDGNAGAIECQTIIVGEAIGPAEDFLNAKLSALAIGYGDSACVGLRIDPKRRGRLGGRRRRSVRVDPRFLDTLAVVRRLRGELKKIG